MRPKTKPDEIKIMPKEPPQPKPEPVAAELPKKRKRKYYIGYGVIEE